MSISMIRQWKFKCMSELLIYYHSVKSEQEAIDLFVSLIENNVNCKFSIIVNVVFTVAFTMKTR